MKRMASQLQAAIQALLASWFRLTLAASAWLPASA
jgi:hypothetical protein